MAQQKTVDFITQHQKYIVLAEKVKEKIETSNSKFTFLLTIYAQNNITIEWKPIYTESSTSVYFRFSERFSIFEFSCNKSIKDDQQKSLKILTQHSLENATQLDPPLSQKYLNAQTISYLDKADIIAKEGYNCDSGDNYQANLYSEIVISDGYIQLNQTNWWNAKSLDRDNYCMRKLLFLISFQDNKETMTQTLKKECSKVYSFREMLAGFEDTSSPNHRNCGQLILTALKKEFQ